MTAPSDAKPATSEKDREQAEVLHEKWCGSAGCEGPDAPTRTGWCIFRDELALALSHASAEALEWSVVALGRIVDDHYNNHGDPKNCPNGGNECSVEIMCEFVALASRERKGGV